MVEVSVSASASQAGTPRKAARAVSLLVLIVSAVAAGAWLLGTDAGRAYLDREHLRQLGVAGRGWMADNPLVTFALFVSAYVVCAILLLPVWWLQLLAGFAFGLWVGLAWVMIASTCGALATVPLARWLGEEWVHAKVVGTGKGARRLRAVLDVVGHNGLLVVLISRLSYPVPYGVSNYLFGLLGIRLREIAVGTAVGGVPVYAGWVAAGAKPEWLSRWEFWAVVVGANLLILGSLVAHSVRAKRRREGVGVASS
jgi:uncharacterized membrane protein YdjX (TVP38/TMEM64 family)